jgi:hypothetical protein
MVNHGVGDFHAVNALSLNAGVDMDMVGEGFLNTLQKSMKEEGNDSRGVKQEINMLKHEY